MRNLQRRMTRKGVGWVGHVYTFGSKWDAKGRVATSSDFEGRDERCREVNKVPAVRRALKKAVRRRLDRNEADV